MKLAFSTNAFVRFPLPDAIAAIREAGFAGVEILADAPHAYPDSIDEILTKNVLRTARADWPGGQQCERELQFRLLERRAARALL